MKRSIELGVTGHLPPAETPNGTLHSTPYQATVPATVLATRLLHSARTAGKPPASVRDRHRQGKARINTERAGPSGLEQWNGVRSIPYRLRSLRRREHSAPDQDQEGKPIFAGGYAVPATVGSINSPECSVDAQNDRPPSASEKGGGRLRRALVLANHQRQTEESATHAQFGIIRF